MERGGTQVATGVRNRLPCEAVARSGPLLLPKAMFMVLLCVLMSVAHVTTKDYADVHDMD